MKNILKISIAVAVSLFALGSCDDDYDPIGNNKPATKLRMTSAFFAFGGEGGELTSTVNTNAPDIAVGTLPEWIESVTFNDDKTQITVKAKANTDPLLVRTGSFTLITVTGENESSLTAMVVQSAKDARIGFQSFTEKNISDDTWTSTDQSKVTIGGGYLNIEGAGNGVGNSLYYRNSNGLVHQSNAGTGNVVAVYVDVRVENGTEGGLKAYYNPVNGDEFRFFFTMGTQTTGSFYAFRFKDNNQQNLALGDAIPSAGLDPVPEVGVRDEYMRIEFTNIPRWPNWWQSEVNIYSLQTRDGETKVLAKHFSRKFEIDGPKPEPGYFGLWGRFGNVRFRNFTLSAQDN